MVVIKLFLLVYMGFSCNFDFSVVFNLVDLGVLGN